MDRECGILTFKGVLQKSTGSRITLLHRTCKSAQKKISIRKQLDANRKRCGEYLKLIPRHPIIFKM